jgi:SAM-dependent methyltransferase
MSILGNILYRLRKVLSRKRSLDETHLYWKAPADGKNSPDEYLGKGLEPRSKFLVDLISRHVGMEARILEIGCNVGRNLNYLYEAGFSNLEEIEISELAVQKLRETYPKMARDITIHNAPVEMIVKQLQSSHYDVVFTMAVLEHIHSDSEWIFSDMARIAKNVLVTIEDEREISWRHYPRNYQSVFERLSMKQIDVVDNMHKYGLPLGMICRVFREVNSACAEATPSG